MNVSPEVLLLEGNDQFRKVLAKQFVQWGMTTHLARNGWGALDLARSRSFDLFVIDCFLPGMSGFRLTELLREEGLVGEAAVLGMSANVSGEFAIHARHGRLYREAVYARRIRRRHSTASADLAGALNGDGNWIGSTGLCRCCLGRVGPNLDCGQKKPILARSRACGSHRRVVLKVHLSGSTCLGDPPDPLVLGGRGRRTFDPGGLFFVSTSASGAVAIHPDLSRRWMHCGRRIAVAGTGVATLNVKRSPRRFAFDSKHLVAVLPRQTGVRLYSFNRMGIRL